MLNNKTVNIVFALLLMGMLCYDFMLTLSPWIYVLLVLVFLALQAYGSAVLSAQFFMPVRYQGPENSNRIALTFDDGPIPGKTEAILNVLRSYHVPAAFFCIGNRVATSPALARSIYDAGHLIGNHSYWHRPTFDLQSTRKVRQELRDTDQAISDAVGVKPNFFRPPYGVTNPMVAQAVKDGDYVTVGWSVRSFDTVIHDGPALLKRITKSLKGGDVILLHDYCDSTLQILPELLDHISRRGLKIVRVDELLNERAYA
jgi:peptidoglycan/xylan/chitin deacetylase (PgdA/CDA1 family)